MKPPCDRHAALRAHGFSMLEVIVILVIALVLLAVAFTHYARVQEDAERSARQAVLESLRMALALKATETALREGAAKVGELNRSNPFTLLDEKPSNYGGEIHPSGDMAPTTWYYAPATGELLYAERWSGGTLSLSGISAVHHYRVEARFGAGGVDGVIVKHEKTSHR